MTLILHNDKVHLKIIAWSNSLFSYSFEVIASLIIKVDIH